MRRALAQLRFVAYCGIAFTIEETIYRSEVADLRRTAARRIRSARRRRQDVRVLEPGREWEFATPDDAAMISDFDGFMVLRIPSASMVDDEQDEE